MAQIVYAKLKECLWVVSVVCVGGWFIGGCASYNAQTQKISQSYEQCNIHAAATQISMEADKRGDGKDAVVWRLEQGAVLRAAGKLEDSNRAFDKAEELVNKYEEAAKMSVSPRGACHGHKPYYLTVRRFCVRQDHDEYIQSAELFTTRRL